MPRFRPRSSADSDLCDTPLSPETIRWLAADVTRLCHFSTSPHLRLEGEHRPSEESVWEVFQGRLLDPAHTRQTRTFEAWNIWQVTDEGRSGEPLVSVKWDQERQQIHVVRGLDSYVWEGYDSGGGVYLSRERRKCVRELVGSIDLSPMRDVEELRDELICLLFNAVVGTSRLPLAPVETPLPAFSFGELLYCYRADGLLSRRERVKQFETYLQGLSAGENIDESIALFRSLFNEVSLSPYTELTGKALSHLRRLEQTGRLLPAEIVDFLGHLLRQNGRHLTAYDLTTFHHRGANYPDALLLDEVLKEYLSHIEARPDLFQDRLRRRALRQAWLHRRAYEGHLVPDVPTSPGEQMRVLPPSHPRVSEEQISQPAKRKRQLFADDPLTKYLTPHVETVLRQSLADLEHPDELRELGMAIYLDRPFNVGKPPAEPDGTLLLSAEAFSRNLALQRLHQLPRWFESVADAIPKDCAERLLNLPVAGLPLERIGNPARPGIISLTDARLASPDFIFLRTTRSTIGSFLDLYDLTPLAERFDISFLTERRHALFARAPGDAALIAYDGELRPRLEMHVPAHLGYQRRAGHEYPSAGLWVVGVWQNDGERRHVSLRNSPIVLNVR